MNQSRIWLVVNPTVGLPLFLGSVATISLIVHASVLKHSTWFPAFIQGGNTMKRATVETEKPAASKLTGHFLGGQAAKVMFDAEDTPSRMGTLVFADGRTLRVSVERPDLQSRAAIIRFEDGQTAKVIVSEPSQPRFVAAGIQVDSGPAK